MDTSTTEIYTLSLHDALPIFQFPQIDVVHAEAGALQQPRHGEHRTNAHLVGFAVPRSEEHTSELQSLRHLVCRLLLEKKKTRTSHIRRLLSVFEYRATKHNIY